MIFGKPYEQEPQQAERGVAPEEYSRERCEKLVGYLKELYYHAFKLSNIIFSIETENLGNGEIATERDRIVAMLSSGMNKLDDLTESIQTMVDVQINAAHGEANDLVAKYEELKNKKKQEPKERKWKKTILGYIKTKNQTKRIYNYYLAKYHTRSFSGNL